MMGNMGRLDPRIEFRMHLHHRNPRGIIASKDGHEKVFLPYTQITITPTDRPDRVIVSMRRELAIARGIE